MVKLRSNENDPIFAYCGTGEIWNSIIMQRETANAISFRMYNSNTNNQVRSCYIGVGNVVLGEWVTIIVRVDKFVSGMPAVSLDVITAGGTIYSKMAGICSRNRVSIDDAYWTENCCDWNYDTSMFDDRVQSRIHTPVRYVGTSIDDGPIRRNA